MAGKEYQDAAAYGMAMDAKKKAAKKEKKAPKKPAPKKTKMLEPESGPPRAPIGKGTTAPMAGKPHLVAEGQTLSELAESTGVTVAAIQAANPQIKGTTIVVGKTIKIPKKAEK